MPTVPVLVTLALAVVHVLAPAAVGEARAQERPEPGPFAALEGTRLGEPDIFMRASVLPEIPPVSTRCLPLLDEGGAVLAWVASVAEAGGRVLIRRCVDGPAPAEGLPGGVQRGGAAVEWETAVREGGGLVTAPLGLPDWSFFSNPAFCGSRVAYWAFQAAELFVQVFDLDVGRVLAAERRGVLQLVADEADTLDAPVWRDGCAAAVFRAARLGRREVVLTFE